MKEGDQLLDGYLQEFGKLKERTNLKEVLEREMLLTFIRANTERIAEFPLLEVEQNGIITLLSRRAFDHPCQEYLKTWLGSFLINLNHYAKTKNGGASDKAALHKKELLNAEKILIQCLQGVVFAVGLAKDNAAHAIVATLGPRTLDYLQEVNRTVEPDEGYWRALVERFILKHVALAYENILAAKRYTLSKDDAFMVLRFHLDDVLRHGGEGPVEVAKTRIQQAYETLPESPEGRERIACLQRFLRGALQPEIVKNLEPRELDHAAQIVCMDPLAAELCAALTPGATPPPAEPPSPEEAARQFDELNFLKEQALAMAVGATMAAAILKQDFLRALKEFPAPELRQVAETMGTMERSRMIPTVGLLLEFGFCHHLRQQAGEDSAKLQLRALRRRRAPKAAVEALSADGLNRIRQKKFFAEDPDDPDALLFTAKTPAELQQLLSVFQMEEPLLRKLLLLWQKASQKVDILAALNLRQLAKVSTNLPQRVGEILTALGIAVR